MESLTRTIIVLVVFCLAMSSPAPSQTNPEGKVQTFIISGSVGVDGVIMKGLPGDPVTNSRGSYSAVVKYGWDGTVTPTKEGFTFTPASIIYHNVNSDRTNENYAATIITNTISGKVGLQGAEMQGLPGNPVTDKRGYYSATVEYGWSGTVEPIKEGYLFRPASKVYTKVVSDFTNENYTPEIIRYTISGQVWAPYYNIMMQGLPGNPGVLSGVLMQGLPGNPVTDENGYYTCIVDYGWSGTVKPVKEGYTFNPPRLSYVKVVKDQKKQNYTPERVSQVESRYDERGWVLPQAVDDTRVPRRRGRSTSYRSTLAPMASRKVLVVPAAEVKEEDLAEIIEDLQIMSHILDERFRETRRIQGVFTDFGDFFGRDNRQTEATYLQGYGVLFSMEVNFAFSPPPKPQVQVTKQGAEPVDSTWQEAKQQVFSPGESRSTRGSDSAHEYNSRMVEELKQDLITTLKHASNIRGVQPEEWIILTVIGSGRQGGGFGGGGFMMGGMGGMYGGTSSGGMMGGMGAGMGGFGGSSGGGGMGGSMMGAMGGMGGFSEPGVFSEMGVSPTTVLTIRAKKSDIDAYAKDEQLLEQFRRRVQILIY